MLDADNEMAGPIPKGDTDNTAKEAVLGGDHKTKITNTITVTAQLDDGSFVR